METHTESIPGNLYLNAGS